MEIPERGQILINAVAVSTAAVPLAYSFAHSELSRWWNDQPGALAVLFVVGFLLSLAGALLPRYLSLPRVRTSSQVRQTLQGGAVGLAFGLTAGAVGWFAADASLWALLIWFFLAALLLSGAQAVLPRRVRRHG